MSKPKATLFFAKGSEDLAKRLAQAIRVEGSECALVCLSATITQHQHITSADAALFQESSPFADTVADLYRRHYPSCEIHFFDEEGEFLANTNQCPATNEEIAAAEKDVEASKDAEAQALAAAAIAAAAETGEENKEPPIPPAVEQIEKEATEKPDATATETQTDAGTEKEAKDSGAGEAKPAKPKKS